MNRFKISGRFLPSPQGEDPFARWIKKYGKARHVRDLVCAGGNDALKGKLSGLARAFLDGHLKIFMAQIDALEKEGLPDGVFEAMEAAKATRGIKYAGQLEPEVSKIVGRKSIAQEGSS
jgi:hypothetical protein